MLKNLLGFLFKKSSPQSSPFKVSPENIEKKATKKQIDYLQVLIDYENIRFPDGTPENIQQATKQLIKLRANEEISKGISRGRTSLLIETYNTGVYGPDKLLNVLGITKKEIQQFAEKNR